MVPSMRTTTVDIDAASFSRLVEIGKEEGLYNSRIDATKEDNLEQVLTLLINQYEEEQ